MKTIAVAALMVGMLVGSVGESGAVVCAAGVYRAGCAGPRGAVVTHRAPVARCYWRAGRRVCVR
ncbi:hypothetical protein DFR50_102176 [Roseiarcus fermentans]|uniref:Uncharacterized protein n=1 Tax=Roseiarcus fermentans TaxID=1473586 RepID=A0A366FSL5_9HYPH|nr:hypothetical protein [Roseiarcus fermentans]RBP17684.1 hypothetical protein DFR50_102176 [Roseiarcus fermentans]